MVNLKRFSKVVKNLNSIYDSIKPDSVIAVGGFGVCGVPNYLLKEILKRPSLNKLTFISNNAGLEDYGIGLVLKNGQVKRMISSYVGENKNFESQYLGGNLEVELIPQGTLAEKLRATGAGIQIFGTKTGIGTAYETGGFVIKYDSKGNPLILSDKKEIYENSEGEKFLLERPFKVDFGFVKAWKADKTGNLLFRKTAQNFNPDVAKASKFVIAEVEELVEDGEFEIGGPHLPGIYVDAIFVHKEQKPIERLANSENMKITEEHLKDIKFRHRYKIAKRAGEEVSNGMYINLGIGIPTLIPSFLPPAVDVNIHVENGSLGLDGYPDPGHEDPDLIDASKSSIKVKKSASYFGSSDSFAIVRGGHLDITFLGALQISKNGDLANWVIPGKKLNGMGGAMDLVNSGSKVIVLTEHTEKNGKLKILNKCAFPLTGKQIVSKIITELAVFEIDKEKGLILKEIAIESSFEEVKSKTECDFIVDLNLKRF